jgi:hypothetical protein
MATPAATLPELLGPLRGLLVKENVAIGGLSESQRRLALALVWADLPVTVMTEREANEALRASLTGAAMFLGTDHVELRRWLVDSGWLTRDGFGREYQRVDGRALPQSLQALAAAFAGIDTVSLAAGLRATHAAERAKRRRAWDARQGGPG